MIIDPKKWVFWSQTWPKGKTFDLRPNLVSIEGEQTVEREKRRGEEEEEEEEEEKKRSQAKRYGN